MQSHEFCSAKTLRRFLTKIVEQNESKFMKISNVDIFMNFKLLQMIINKHERKLFLSFLKLAYNSMYSPKINEQLSSPWYLKTQWHRTITVLFEFTNIDFQINSRILTVLHLKLFMVKSICFSRWEKYVIKLQSSISSLITKSS